MFHYRLQIRADPAHQTLRAGQHLNRREVDHVVATLPRHLQPLLPVRQGAKPLRKHSLALDAVLVQNLICTNRQCRVYQIEPRTLGFIFVLTGK